ncbi:TIGR03086 family metal-binding protein [Prauserella cavernicola]|uniref:TIGR03086 family protein n=1 Tax=Prauserella cavernicola TaxID=2800127 RepID=A0A934QZE1_9PSEU|nr:TIGR03086 family metal-binding protein [Prauserella cavernicola]MBK1789423.1 TIGR03086 family protein [Prauserella cavernicola]
MNVRELDRRALALAGAAVAAVTPDQLSLPTPCADWTLRGLLRHLVSQNEGFAAAARGEGRSLRVWRDGRLSDDPRTAFAASAALVTDAFAVPDVLDAPFALPEIDERRPFPGRQAIAFHCLDAVVHAWDVAVTVGAAWEPDDELLAAALRVAERVPGEGRGPGAAFDTGVPADGLPLGARLLALLGRSPSWPR